MKLSTIASLYFIIILSISCQQNKLSKNVGELTKDMQQDHSGEITFMNGFIPIEDYAEEDILKSFDLEEDSNLNMRVFLSEPLSYHLGQLAPALSAEELCKKGNYQFRFYIDDQMVYEENLNSGAGSCEQKSNNKSFSVPLVSTQNEDSWGRYLWMRFLFRGGGDAALLKAGPHKFKMEARPYVMNPTIKVGKIIAEGSVTLNVIKPIATNEEIAIQEIAEGSGWEISSASYDKQKIRDLNKKIVEKGFRDIQSIVIIKDGELVLEEYFNGAVRSTLHNPRSVGKTFASTAMGFAIAEGHIESEKLQLKDFYNLKSFSNYSPEKEKVSLESLLMMSSGFDADDNDYDSPGNEEYMYPTDDWVKFALDLPMDNQKKMGEDWTYFTAGIVVLGDILNTKVPQGLEKYMHQKLFQPLGISDYQWQYTPTDVPNTAGGIQLRALDFAKYGQLYKNGGQWKGQQILSNDWVNKSLARLVARPDAGYYGYLFWNQLYQVNGKSYEVSFCTGNGGNKIFIFKDVPLVIVITASAYNMPYAHPQVDRIMEDYILPAVLD